MPLSAFDVAPSTADLDAHVSLWADDQQFVLNRLAELDHGDEQNIFTDRLDLAHVGAVGHGFGGAAAIALAQRDPGITGVVDLDGFVYGPARNATAPLPVPLLVLEARHDVGSSTDALWEAGTVGAQEPIAGAGPLGFTDLGRIGNGLGLPANPPAFGDTDILAVTVEKLAGFFPR
jgi:pimeloyl-ACP methyl ester carboxylesterase